MKNICKSSKNPLDVLDLLAENSRKCNRSFLKMEKETLALAFKQYNAACEPLCSLERLSPLWTDDEKFLSFKKRDIAYNLYSSRKQIIRKLWEELSLNNGENAIICPICEIDYAVELDHYIPRNTMPEYSIHLYNLIPLCHKCNHDKGDKWLNNGSRIFFNAYFDKAQSNPIFLVDVVIVNNSPKIQITINETNNSTIVNSTINKLDLIKKVEPNLNKELRAEIVMTESRYSRPADASLFFKKEKIYYERVIEKSEIPFVRRILYRALLNSKDYEDWIINKLEHMP